MYFYKLSSVCIVFDKYWIFFYTGSAPTPAAAIQTRRLYDNASMIPIVLKTPVMCLSEEGVKNPCDVSEEDLQQPSYNSTTQLCSYVVLQVSADKGIKVGY